MVKLNRKNILRVKLNRKCNLRIKLNRKCNLRVKLNRKCNLKVGLNSMFNLRLETIDRRAFTVDYMDYNMCITGCAQDHAHLQDVHKIMRTYRM